MESTGLFSNSQPFGLSPSSHEEDFDDFGNMSDGDSVEQMDSACGPRRKGRRLPSTAEKRANHNAIERARRESLNGRFMELARALPTMAVVKRPSKNSIVLKSLEFVKGARAREQSLEAENASLRSEVNELRAKLGMQLLEMTVPTTVVSQAPTISAVKQEAPVSRPAAVVTAKPVAAPAPAKPALSRHSSTPLMASSTGPYLAHDPLAALTGLHAVMLDPFSSSVKIEASSPQSSSSDSESSLAHTPPAFHSYDASSSFFFEDAIHAPPTGTTTFDNDFLAQCGLQSGFSSVSSWHTGHAGGMFGAQPASTAFPLFT